MSKNTKLGEHLTLQFRAEFFNILNHPNFAGINQNLEGSSPGLAAFTPDLGALNPSSGAEVHVTFSWEPNSFGDSIRGTVDDLSINWRLVDCSPTPAVERPVRAECVHRALAVDRRSGCIRD